MNKISTWCNEYLFLEVLNIWPLFLGMYSLLQMKTNLLGDNNDEIPLPELTSEGWSTFNEVTVKKSTSFA